MPTCCHRQSIGHGWNLFRTPALLYKGGQTSLFPSAQSWSSGTRTFGAQRWVSHPDLEGQADKGSMFSLSLHSHIFHGGKVSPSIEAIRSLPPIVACPAARWQKRNFCRALWTSGRAFLRTFAKRSPQRWSSSTCKKPFTEWLVRWQSLATGPTRAIATMAARLNMGRDLLDLHRHLKEPSAIEQAQLPSTAKRAIQALHSDTFFVLPGQADRVRTQHGSRPGDSYADVVFGYLIDGAHPSQLRDISRSSWRTRAFWLRFQGAPLLICIQRDFPNELSIPSTSWDSAGWMTWRSHCPHQATRSCSATLW